MDGEASKEDIDKVTAAEMDESVVNNQNDKSACDKTEPDVTRRGTNQTQSKDEVPNVKVNNYHL
jgi:hypothetical protein